MDKKKYLKKCLFCGKSIHTNIKIQKFCSKDCYNKYCRKYSASYEKYRNKKKIKCIICRKLFLPRTHNQKFCSKGCSLKPRKEINLHKPLVREFFLERANFKCGECGIENNENLHIHHIKPLYKGGDNNSNNLIVLCEKCHKKKHKIW